MKRGAGKRAEALEGTARAGEETISRRLQAAKGFEKFIPLKKIKFFWGEWKPCSCLPVFTAIGLRIFLYQMAEKV
jgi:hypothetical protein